MIWSVAVGICMPCIVSWTKSCKISEKRSSSASKFRSGIDVSLIFSKILDVESLLSLPIANSACISRTLYSQTPIKSTPKAPNAIKSSFISHHSHVAAAFVAFSTYLAANLPTITTNPLFHGQPTPRLGLKSSRRSRKRFICQRPDRWLCLGNSCTAIG